jgi:hypothetical protein
MTRSIFILLFFLLISTLTYAQPEIILPSDINILINDSIFEPSESWTDSLINEAGSGYVRYEIASTYRNSNQVRTRIRVPQFFPFSQVIRQVIIYHGLINDEESSQSEELLIYPFFSDLDKKPAATCTFIKNGWYQFKLDTWSTIPLPEIPTPEEKYLYNQLMDSVMTEFGDRDGISEDAFEAVAKSNNISTQTLKNVYKTVKMWLMAQ